MNLTPLQLQIQEWSDKSLSIGCLLMDNFGYYSFIRRKYELSFDWKDTPISITVAYSYRSCEVEEITNEFEIIWHPMDWWRLCYISSRANGSNINKRRTPLYCHFSENAELYNQTILERPEETHIACRDFLLSLHK